MSVFVLSGHEEAHASVFSFISNVFGSNEAQGKTSEGKNSQNLSILEAPLASKLAIGGGDITIVDSNALAYESETSDVNQSDQISTYVVRNGDTLSAIAKMFNVSVNTIVWANDIKGGVISPGQVLTILPISGVKYTVKSGDTIQSIVKKSGGDLNDVLSFNDISIDTKLVVGDVVIIPNGDAAPVTPATKPSSGGTKPKPGVGGASIPGYFIAPLDHYVETQGIHGYNAVDLAAPFGSPVHAAAAGTVIVSKSGGYNGGYGTYVVISHPNGTQTLYAHMSANIVSVGEHVSQGQHIGDEGATGKATGPHVHFEVRGAKNPF